MVRTVLFDLDGTITDSEQGIINSIRYALCKYEIEIPSETILRAFIGPPLKEQFQNVFRLDEAEAISLVEAYREYYAEKGIFENKVYSGIFPMLSRLREAGLQICMATAKPEKYAKQIAEHFEFAEYFDFIGGACMDGKRTDKYEVIEYVLQNCNVEEREKTVMVGDRSHDMIGASKAGVKSIGVLYGYGTREELECSGARKIADTAERVADLILKM